MVELGATPEQLRLIDWIAQTNQTAATLEAAAVCRVLSWEENKMVLVWPDGSYQVVRAGTLHKPPWRRRGQA